MTAMSLRRWVRLAAVAATATLGGCYLPEKFTASLDFDRQGAYTYRFDGTVVHQLAALEIAQSGSLSAKTDSGLRSNVDKLAKAEGVSRARYQGNGRVEVQLAGRKARREELSLFSGVFQVATDAQGVTTIRSIELTPKAKKDLELLDIRMDGSLRVKLPSGATVLEHNASSTPSFGGLVGAYQWRVGSVGDRPFMRVKFAEAK